MNRSSFCLILSGFLTGFSLTGQLHAQDQSFRNEVKACIQRGVGFLAAKQNADGSWGDPSVPGIQPALTSLAVMSYACDPANANTDLPPAAKKGMDFLLSKQQPDGGIYVDKSLATYNTALALTAISTSPLTPTTRAAGIKARRFVVGLQSNFDEKNNPTKNAEFDSQYNGGIGYTNKTTYSDLSNTHLALEALYYSKNLFESDSQQESSEPKLDFAAAIKFVARCQNLKEANDQPWVNEAGGNKGGFIYRPGESKTEPMKTEDGREALRSYGSMGYAGLLSYIYSDMKPDDKRVLAVKEWLGKNYTMTENPGMGQQGLYYYFHTMSKTLALLPEFKDPSGKQISWQKDLSKMLFDKQGKDGSWSNDTGRWMEKDPILVTSYSILALGHLYRSL